MTNASPVDQLSIPPCCPKLAPNTVCDILDYQYRQLYHPKVGDRIVTVDVIIHVRFQRCPLAQATWLQHDTSPRRKGSLVHHRSPLAFHLDSETKAAIAMSSRRKNTMPCPLGATSCPISPGRILPLHQHFPGTFRHSRRDQQCPGYDLWPPLTSAETTTLVRPAIFCVSCPSTPARLITAPRWGAELRAASRSARSKPAPTPKGRKNHFEWSSREFSNPNRCHAVTFFFYRVNNTQTVKFTLEAIERRVVDPAADTKVTNNSFASHGDVSTIPSAVLATDKKRLDIEGIGRTSVTSEQQATWPATFDCKRSTQPCWGRPQPLSFVPPEPLPDATHKEALQAVDKQLVAAGLLDTVGDLVATDTQKEFSFEIKSSLPTPGALVKGCLDDSDVCEDTLEQEIKLDLERKRLENLRLQREIDLMRRTSSIVVAQRVKKRPIVWESSPSLPFSG